MTRAGDNPTRAGDALSEFKTPSAVIIGAGQARYQRHPASVVTTESLIADAALAALADSELERHAIDGLGVASFSLSPDHAIDLAWRLGLRLQWIMDDANGGASGVNMLQHAARALAAGDATRILLVGGDCFGRGDFGRLVDNYNRHTRDELASLPLAGPNSLFAFLTQRHAATKGLARATYGAVPVAQRRWAALNENAVYRTPLTMEDYLAAPQVAPPLGRYDCVPVVSGADAVIVAASGQGAAVRGIANSYNHDGQAGDGLHTGLAEAASRLWTRLGLRPEDVDLACVYDDYPVMALIQLDEAGLIAGGDLERFTRQRLLEQRWPLNTSGGMLSAGQAGAAGGLHGLVEATIQLKRRAGRRQVDALTAVVTGYGMVLARYGACANIAVLERSG